MTNLQKLIESLTWRESLAEAERIAGGGYDS